ncbi:MAG: TolC family protein [Cyclobacteriaceae bacterium]|nr:TolC family protein [Cyclobacteriaceae bacterium]
MFSLGAGCQTKLTLPQALERVKAHNPDLRWLEENIDVAAAGVTDARIKPNPILNVQLLHISNRRFFTENTVWYQSANTQYWYQMTKPFQVAGQRKNKIALADNGLLQSRLDYDEQVRQALFEASQVWLDAWAAAKKSEILEQGLANVDSLVRISEFRLRDQVITKTDYLRTDLLRQQYQRDLTLNRQFWYIATHRLQLLTGVSDTLLVDVQDDAFAEVFPGMDSLVAEALSERTDIKAQRNAVRGSQLNEDVQRSFSFPQPELGGMWNPQNRVPYWGLYGTIEIPIFNRNQGQRERARVLTVQADEQLWAARQRAQTEVVVAVNKMTTFQTHLINYRNTLREAEEIVRSVRYSYLKGATSIVDLLEAQRSWLDTQMRYHETMEAYRRSYLEVLFVSGKINQVPR